MSLNVCSFSSIFSLWHWILIIPVVTGLIIFTIRCVFAVFSKDTRLTLENRSVAIRLRLEAYEALSSGDYSKAWDLFHIAYSVDD